MAHARPFRFRTTAARGFTLIELMITVAVIAILARIALPAYTDYIRRGKLTEAFNQMTADALALGQYYQDNRTYVGASCPSSTTNFTYTCTVSATGYTIQADGSTNSTTGFRYTLTDQGGKATPQTNAGYPTSTSCWIANKAGTCF
jgi:type IV pilus assembly protein PilE